MLKVLHYCIDKVNGIFFTFEDTRAFDANYYPHQHLHRVDQTEPLQEFVFVKHTNGLLNNILQQTVLLYNNSQTHCHGEEAFT